MKIDEAIIERDFEEKRILIALLTNMMIADGRIHDNEQDFLNKKGSKLALSRIETKRIMTDTMLGKYKPELPEDTMNRYSILIDIVIMMFVDNEIHDKEIKLCRSLSPNLGFSEELIPHIIKIIKDCYYSNLSYSTCFNLLKKLLEK
jgi:hypothetical protein